jgi:hypothetical protein
LIASIPVRIRQLRRIRRTSEPFRTPNGLPESRGRRVAEAPAPATIAIRLAAAGTGSPAPARRPNPTIAARSAVSETNSGSVRFAKNRRSPVSPAFESCQAETTCTVSRHRGSAVLAGDIDTGPSLPRFGPPWSYRDGPDELVELARFPFEPPASALVAALRAAGIAAECLGGPLKNSNIYFAICLPLVVFVRREDLEVARTFLEHAELPEGWEDEAERTAAEDGEGQASDGGR